MQVHQVYLMRCRGERIPVDELRASRPLSGFVRVDRTPGGRVGHWTRSAFLLPADGGLESLAQLHDIQLQLWDRRGIVIAGTEMQWDRKITTRYRQSWFIVLSPPGAVIWSAEPARPKPHTLVPI